MRKVYRMLKLIERLTGAVAAWFEEFAPEWDAEREKAEKEREGEDREPFIKEAQYTVQDERSGI